MTYQDDSQDLLEIANKIRRYLQENHLTASMSAISYEVLALQLLDSTRLERYLKIITNRNVSGKRCDPKDPLYDPIKAILWLKNDSGTNDGVDKDGIDENSEIDENQKASRYEEACWLAFLLTYTDDSAFNDWSFMRQLYGGAGLVERLTWHEMTHNPQMESDILPELAATLAAQQPKPKFGHHRAYESLSQLPIVFASYSVLIEEYESHQNLFKSLTQSDHEPAIAEATEYFKKLYAFIRQNVYRFGRLSTFEFLCLLGKTGLADISPDSCYIAESSGPKRGAKLLFGQLTNSQLDNHAQALADYIDFGYQEMEAALCHWQKSPMRYVQHKR